MANIPIRDIPGAVVASPDPSNLIPMDNGSLMQKTTIANAVNTTLPLSSQAEAEAGVDNVKRMSPLRTKQAINAQTPGIVNTAITALNLGSMSQETASDYTKTSGLAAVALSNDYNDLDNLPTLGSAAATDASDYATAAQGSLADTAVQPGDSALVPAGGTIGQVLVKNSGTNYDTGWVSSAAATAVSYAPQTLTDAQAGQARANIGASLRGHLYGLTLSNNATDATNDIDIAPGEAASIETDPVLIVLASAMTKRLDATWAAGSGAGGRDAGDTLADATYHVHLVKNLSSGAVDVVLSSNPTAPHTMPSGFTASRRIGSVLRVAGAIVPFLQHGDYFNYPGAVSVRTSTSAQSNTLLALPVPNGVKVRPIIGLLTSATAGSDISVALGDGGAAAPINVHTVGGSGGTVARSVISDFWTNLASQIRFSVVVSAGSISTGVTYLTGYIDPRGKN